MAARARVILTTYEQVEALPLVLRGYLRQTTCDFNLVLADDGSGPEQVALLLAIAPDFAAHGIGFEHVWQPDRGWRKNRVMNEAVRRSQGEELLIFSDADCIPPAHFVETHLAVHEPWSFHVAGAFRLEQSVSERLSEEDIETGAFERLGSDEDRRKLREKARKSRWGTFLRRRHRPKVLGLNMGVDRKLFEAINGFDEQFESPFLGEDTDLRDRLMRHRPRPRVKVLYTRNDVFHLWHPVGSRSRGTNRSYYRQARPARCVRGLVQADASRPAAGDDPGQRETRTEASG